MGEEKQRRDLPLELLRGYVMREILAGGKGPVNSEVELGQ